MKTVKVNRSELLRKMLSEPRPQTGTVQDICNNFKARYKQSITPALVYLVRSQMKKDRAEFSAKAAANSGVDFNAPRKVVYLTAKPVLGPLATIQRITAVAAEVGGLSALKGIVDVMTEVRE